MNSLEKNKKKDPQTCWRLFNKKNSNDILITLDRFYEHFKSLATEEEEYEDIQYEINLINNDSLNEPITACGVLENMKKLKNNKAPGNDMVINEYIKSTQHVFCPLYVKLFNKVLDSGDKPSEWLVGTIVPLYKNKGDTDDTNNYTTKLCRETIYIFFKCKVD